MKDIPHYSLYGKSSAADAPHYLYVARLEESLPKHNWEIHPHRHDQMHQLLVVEEGRVFLQVGDWSAEEQGACVLSVPAREVHGFRHHPGVQGYIITISEPFLIGAFAEAERQAFPFLFTQPLLMRKREENTEDENLFALIRQFVEEYEHPQNGQACLLGAYLKIVFVLLGRAAGHVQTPEQQFDAKITVYEQFLKLLEEHYIKHWPINLYAERLGMTESRLNRLCQRYAGQNALQIMHGRLITEAKRKLMYANLSVNEVSYELGFKDPAYFSRFFNKSCGEPPSQFKARVRSQETS